MLFAILKAIWVEIVKPLTDFIWFILILFFKLIWGILRHLRAIFIPHQDIQLGEFKISFPQKMHKDFDIKLFSILTFVKLSGWSVYYLESKYVSPRFIDIVLISNEANELCLSFRKKFFSNKVDAIFIRNKYDNYNSWISKTKYGTNEELISILDVFEGKIINTK
ncbi:hypothetical protein D3C81_648410 [compost metagenome]